MKQYWDDHQNPVVLAGCIQAYLQTSWQTHWATLWEGIREEMTTTFNKPQLLGQNPEDYPSCEGDGLARIECQNCWNALWRQQKLAFRKSVRDVTVQRGRDLRSSMLTERQYLENCCCRPRIWILLRSDSRVTSRNRSSLCSRKCRSSSNSCISFSCYKTHKGMAFRRCPDKTQGELLVLKC